MATSQSSKSPPVVLSVKNTTKSFGTKKVHTGISFDLQEGELLGLFGGSGVGKSVVLRCIIGLDRPDSGQIIFENQNITQLAEGDLVEVRKKIGYVFQNGALFDSLTVEENLSYPLLEHTQMSATEVRKRVNQMLELVDLPRSNDLLPAELSGGMQKRVGLARAIILQPQIILFDEPTAGLDPTNTWRLIENIQKLKEKGLTGIFVTHDIPSALHICDRIAILDQGKIQFLDTVDVFLNSKDPLVYQFLGHTLDLMRKSSRK